MTPREFLELLWHYKPEEDYILLWTLPDRRSHWFQDIGNAAEFAGMVGTSLDVYVGVGLSKQDFGSSQRCRSEQVSGICGIGIDLDLKSEAHGNKPLPSTLADAFSLLPGDLLPTVTIATGNGAHAWWLFKEPCVFDSDQHRANVTRVLARWHTMLRLNSAARGWVYDRLSDLARILRIPGTLNLKNPGKPKEVGLHSRTDRFYELSDIEEYLDDATNPEPEEQRQTTAEWNQRFADKPLVINPNARISQELLDAWMDPKQTDPRTAAVFRNTWERRRDNLKDPSQSGYDMALADFGVDAGLSEQQIADLINHHRAIHKQRARLSVDYFQRTITKAQDRSENRPAIPLLVGVDRGNLPAPYHDGTTPGTGMVGAPDAPLTLARSEPIEGSGPTMEGSRAPETNNSAPPAPDSESEARKKALLCEEISRAINTPIVRFVMVDGKDPQYRIELASGRQIEVTSYIKFIDQSYVLAVIGAATRRLIPRLKRDVWQRIAQAMLNACYVEEGTDDLGWAAAMRIHLRDYLAHTNFIRTIEEETRSEDQRKPMVVGGKITVLAAELQTYVNKTAFQNYSVRAVAGVLSAMGGKPLRLRGAKYDQSRWALPLPGFEGGNSNPGFDPADYPHEEETRHVSLQ